MMSIQERFPKLFAVTLIVTILAGSVPIASVRATVLSQAGGEDWPMLQHDVRHSGYTPITFVSPDYDGTLNVKWKVGLGERIEVEMQPIVAYGHVYIGVMNGKLHAIDEETGEIRWTYQSGGAISHTPAAGEGKVFFGTEDHKIYALNALTGEEIWTYKTDGPILSSPIVHDQTVYIGGFDHHLYALDTETGSLRWRYDAGDRVWTSPSLDIDNNRLYFGSEQPKAHCLNASTGQLIWVHSLTGEGMRNTYPTFAHNVVIFQTIKPGASAYYILEGFPAYINDVTTLQQYAQYYTQYPERRHLYYLNATTGEDMWDGQGTNYVPVMIPDWGFIEPVIDPQGYAWISATSGMKPTGAPPKDIDLYKVDLTTGQYIKVAEREDFFLRADEPSRFTFANGVYFTTAQSAVGRFNFQSNQMKRIFGPPPHSAGFECTPLDPMPVECTYVDRIAGTPGLGGVHRASALVIANRTGFYTTHGWLYALTPDSVATAHSVDLGDTFTAKPHKSPPGSELAYNDLVSELNTQVEQIIAYGHLEPFPYLWNWDSGLPPSLWQEGEMVRSLAYTMPYLTEENQNALKAYLRNEVTNYLLDPNQHFNGYYCQLYGSYEVVDCTDETYGDEIRSRWFANNVNYIAEEVYAFYAYAKYSGDWQLIEDNWDFIVSRYNSVVGFFDSNLGHAVTRRWLDGQNLDLQTQAACFYAMKEMATHLGYDNLANQAEDYYNQVIQARIYYGNNLIPELYDNGTLTPTTPVGFGTILYPPEGVINRETDIRQLGWRNSERIELRVSGTSQVTVELAPGVYEAYVGDYDYPVAHLQMYPEIGEALSPHLQQATQKYINAIAFYNPWWYWGNNGFVSHKGGENLYSKPFMAAGLFQAKAYILKEDFNTLKDYLPWPVNRAGFRDIYRLQNLVALLRAMPLGTKSVSSITADHGDVLTYTISLLGIGATATLTDTIPAGTAYVPNSAQVEPQIGTLTDDSNLIHWTGVLAESASLELTFAATVTVEEPFTIVNTAIVDNGEESRELTAATITNGPKHYLPIVIKG